MIDFEAKMFNVTIYDDAFVGEKEINFGGNGTLISFEDICQQFNLTQDEDQDVFGPTPPKELGPKVSRPLY